eukprot:TRINITY_DN100637_c0_g1_i1.p1 TRINITY_DN100637_c0_g1~~TRINITY_DN100637_c0_g1_i1.p1  ORF type:complete len:462 (+),score=113.23 TRINITY_DN100637_c0_g1_i1:77-1462(+)
MDVSSFDSAFVSLAPGRVFAPASGASVTRRGTAELDAWQSFAGGSFAAGSSPSACWGQRTAGVVVATTALYAALGLRKRQRTSQRSAAAVVCRAVAEAVATEAPPADDFSNAVDAKKMEFAKFLFSDVLCTFVPEKFDVFMTVVQGSGWNILAKDEWKKITGDMHPFIMPLAVRGEFDGDDELEVLGLLVRSPNGAPLGTQDFHVVSQKPRKTKMVHLVAFDIQKYIMKRAEEATFRKEKLDLPIIEATKDVYDVRFKGTDKNALDRWLLLNVGAFPDVYYNLTDEHVRKGETQTGLVIADTMRDAFGQAWGFPHAYCCKILRDNFDGKGEVENRDVEADHCAQRCFTSGYPLWTLDAKDETDMEMLNTLLLEAKMPKLGDMNSLRIWYLKRVTDDQRAAVRTGSISHGCATLAKAQALMDAVCCSHKSYKGIREEMRDLYEEVPGCEALMDMIDYFTLKE